MSVGRPLRLFLVAAEPSGDALGAGLIRALRELDPDRFECVGVGGAQMAGEGVVSPFDISELAILGIVEGLKAYPRVIKLADLTAAHAAELRPDAAILIDSWGFTLRVAQRLKRQSPDLPIVKYLGPQVWATRPGRAKTLAATVDHVLTLQPFEAPYYEPVGLPATFVGHPVLDRVEEGDAAGFRVRHGILERQRVLALLFGSRRAEVRRLAPVFGEVIERLNQRYGEELVIVSPLAGSVATQVRAYAAEDSRLHGAMLIDEDERVDVFAAADASIACSGTVTTQLAMAGVPTVVAYKLSLVTWLIAKVIYKAPHVSLINMALDERVMPEFIQGEATAARLVAEASRFLDDPAHAATVSAKLLAGAAMMRGEGGASARAANAVVDVLADRGLLSA